MLRNHCTAALRDNDRFHIVVRSAVDLQLRVVVLAGAKSSLPARELVVLVERHLVGWRQAPSGRDRLKRLAGWQRTVHGSSSDSSETSSYVSESSV